MNTNTTAKFRLSQCEFQLVETPTKGILGRLYSASGLLVGANSKREIVHLSKDERTLWFKTTVEDYRFLMGRCKPSNLLTNRIRTTRLMEKLEALETAPPLSDLWVRDDDPITPDSEPRVEDVIAPLRKDASQLNWKATPNDIWVDPVCSWYIVGESKLSVARLTAEQYTQWKQEVGDAAYTDLQVIAKAYGLKASGKAKTLAESILRYGSVFYAPLA